MHQKLDVSLFEHIIYPDKLYEGEDYQCLIRQSLEITEKELESVEPLIVLDLKGTNYTAHDTYFVAGNGLSWVYKGSQRVLMEEIFNRYQFGYEVWSAWLQKESGLTKTVMPYVSGNQVYLTVPYAEELYRRRRTWLNLSGCQEIWINGRPIQGPLPSSAWEITFYYPKFKVTYRSRIKLILQQLKIAKLLQAQWQAYYMEQLERLNYHWTISYPDSASCLKHVQPLDHEGLQQLTPEDYRIFLSMSAVKETYEGMMHETNKRRHDQLKDTPYARDKIKYLIQCYKDWTL